MYDTLLAFLRAQSGVSMVASRKKARKVTSGRPNL